MRARLHDDDGEDDVAGPLTDDLIREWFRENSPTFHPDRNGSKEAKQAINHAHERLKQLIKSWERKATTHQSLVCFFTDTTSLVLESCM
jgi:hypothetical protein